MREKRTDVDFTEHEHIVELYKHEGSEDIRVDYFRVPNTNYGNIKFVNTKFGLSVYGDYGNWIFCRPFVPSPDGYVSDMYWAEKLRTYSCQEVSKFDTDGTLEEINELINGGLEENGFYGKKLTEGIEWLEDIRNYVYDELEYTHAIYRNDNPLGWDYEDIPFVKASHIRLRIIFDAFDEICKRLI